MATRKHIREHSTTSERAKIDQHRRLKDRVEDIPDGFTVKPNGRDGTVYYREGQRVLELAYEADGTRPGILLYTTGLKTWVLPDMQPTAPDEAARVRGALENWARLQGGPITLVSPQELIRPWEDEPR